MKAQLPASSFQLPAKSKTRGIFLTADSSKLAAGFTLIELLVVVAVMTIVTAVILANYNHFGGEVVLQDLAYDMALTVRQAQVYGISVKNVNTSGTYNVGYGMYFATAATNSFLLFADTVAPDGVYESGEALQTSTLAAGMSIVKLCAPAGTNTSCAGGTSVSTLNILFVRPEPNAWINASCSRPAGSNETCSGGQASARIVVQDTKGDQKSVIVYSNGQITVQ